MIRIDRERLRKLPPSERKEAERLLAELEAKHEANPLLRYNAPWSPKRHPKQLEFHAAKTKIKCFIGGNRCLDANELVRMADGSVKPIADIRPGERVMGADIHGYTRPTTVLAVHENGVKPIYRWVFRKRESEATILATREHQILARHEKWDHNRSVALGHIGKQRTRSRFSVQRGLGFAPETQGEGEEYALLFGMLLGDGYTATRRPAFTAAEAEVAAALQSELAAFGLHATQNSANPIQYSIARPRELARGPAWFPDLLEEWGLACYAHEKRIPDECWNWSNEAVARLVAGLLITDGSVWQAPEGWRVAFSTVSRELTEGLHSLLAERFGVYGSRVSTNRRPDRKRPEYGFTIGNYHSLERLRDQIPLWGRKARLLDEALDTWGGKRSDGSRLRFVECEYVGHAPTYDLTVDHPDHLYLLANGIVTHNSGKTSAGVVDDLIQCVDEEALPDHLKQYKKWQPPVRARIVAPKFNENIEQVILPAIRQWCPRDQLLDASWEKAFSKQRRVLTFANGSTIQFLTFDQDLDAHAGAALHRVHFDEEPEGDKGRALWHENMMRLGDYDGDFIMTMTPLFGLSWSYEEIYSRRDREPDITVITVDSLDNPYVNRDALEREFARMTKEERQARKEGRFVHFAGQFFPEFSLETHGCKPPSREHIQQQSVVVGIDPGLNRTGVVWVAFDNDNVALVFDELYPEQAIVEQIVESIRTVNRKWGIEPDYYVIDPSARNRATINAEAIQSAYMRAGIPTVQGQNDRAAGILEMKRRLQQNGLVVSAACTNLAYEFERYRRDPNSQDEFAAIKKDDHLLDALRYALMSRPWAMDAAPDASPEFWTPGHAPSYEWLAGGNPVSSYPLGNLT